MEGNGAKPSPDGKIPQIPSRGDSMTRAQADKMAIAALADKGVQYNAGAVPNSSATGPPSAGLSSSASSKTSVPPSGVRSVASNPALNGGSTLPSHMLNTRVSQPQLQHQTVPNTPDSAPPNLTQAGIANPALSAFPPGPLPQRSGSIAAITGPALGPRGLAMAAPPYIAQQQNLSRPVSAFPPPIITTTAVNSMPSHTPPSASVIIPANIVGQIQQLQADIAVRDSALKKWTEAMRLKVVCHFLC